MSSSFYNLNNGGAPPTPSDSVSANPEQQSGSSFFQVDNPTPAAVDTAADLLAAATLEAQGIAADAAAAEAAKVAAEAAVEASLLKANNLSDLTNAVTARTNLGLAAISASGSASDLGSGTVPLARLSGITNSQLAAGVAAANLGFTPLNAASNLSDLTNAATARTSLGLATIAASGSASDLGSGTVPLARLSGITNAQLAAGVAIASLGFTPLNAASNLSDLTNSATARTSLGLAAVASSGSASDLSAGTLPAARLPAPSPTTLGGVKSASASANNFQTGISVLGEPTFAQPTAANISGLAASATTNALNASNISSGTLSLTRLGTQAPATVLSGPTSGSNAAPTFRSLIPSDIPGCWMKVGELSATSGAPSASLQYTTIFASGYDDYRLILDEVITVTDAVGMNVQFYHDGSFKTDANYDWRLFSLHNDGSYNGFSNATKLAFIPLTTNAGYVHNASDGGVSGSLTFLKPSSTTIRKAMDIDIRIPNSYNNRLSVYNGSASYDGTNGATAPVTGFKLYAGSGNIYGKITILARKR